VGLLVGAPIEGIKFGADLIRFTFKFIYRDIVEGEHACEPYVVTIGVGMETGDFSTGYRLIETYNATNRDVTRRELTLGIADEFQSFCDGKNVGGWLTLAPPAMHVTRQRPTRFARVVAKIGAGVDRSIIFSANTWGARTLKFNMAPLAVAPIGQKEPLLVPRCARLQRDF
jgi:hypothetical protein